MILDELRGRTRTDIVRLRCMAMRDGSARAIELLDEVARDTEAGGNVVTKVALAMLKAEIFHLDGADDEALKVFDAQITGHFGDLSTDDEIVVRHNYNDVQSSLWSPEATRDFYNLVDQQRMLGFDLTDSKAILGAKNAAAHGKHYDALPDLWNELRRTYRQACWRAHRWAAKDFADECMLLGWPDEACRHAVLALDEPSAKRAGEQLLAFQLKDRIIKALDWMLSNASLLRHFRMACEVIATISDAIPDDRVPRVYEWASNQAAKTPSMLKEAGPVQGAWKVIGAIAHRLTGSQALAAVELATAHPWWKQFCVNRNSLRLVVGRCVNALPTEQLPTLAQDVVSHIVDRHEDHDYTEAVNLIYHIAKVGGDSLRNDVAEQIFKKGTKLTPALVQVAPVFKKESALEASLETWAVHVIERIPRQVQRLTAAEEPKQCSESFFYITANRPDGSKLIVHLVGSTAMHSVIVHRRSLKPETLDALIDAVLKLLEDRDNFLGNKTVLLEVFSRCGDSIAERFASRVFEVVAPFARGEITEPENVMSAADAANPLNRFKMGTGKPSEVQALALYALANIEHAKPGTYGESLEAILEDAITNADPDVREAAFYAWRLMPRWPASVQTSIILGTRDPDQRPAMAAYDTIAVCDAFHPTIDELKVLCQSLAVSVHSRSVEVRRIAATACRKMAESTSDAAVKSKLMTLQQQFREDICYSVRQAAFDAIG